MVASRQQDGSGGSGLSSLAIFDFDGTIADSLAEVLLAYNAVAPRLGIPTISQRELDDLRRLGAREAMRALDVPFWKVPGIMKAVRTAMHARMASLRPFDGMADTLHELWRRGVKTAIVSSNSPENVSEFLARHRIDRFEVLSCGVSLFGKAKRLRRVAQRPDLAAARVFYVGDEIRDVLAAHEAGYLSVAVTWGHGERSALAAQSPYALAHGPAELVTILGSA